MSIGTNCDIQDCFIHDLYNDVVSHTDCIQTDDGVSFITLKHNTLLSLGIDGTETTSAFICPQASTGPHDLLFDNNVLMGGAFSLYGPQNGAGTRVTITNNKFWRLIHPGSSGAFGDWTDCTDEAVVSGNQFGTFSGGYDSTNKLILGTWSGSPLT
jgi:hypothetical protein